MHSQSVKKVMTLPCCLSLMLQNWLPTMRLPTLTTLRCSSMKTTADENAKISNAGIIVWFGKKMCARRGFWRSSKGLWDMPKPATSTNKLLPSRLGVTFAHPNGSGILLSRTGEPSHAPQYPTIHPPMLCSILL